LYLLSFVSFVETFVHLRDKRVFCRLIPLNRNRDIALFDGRNLVQLGIRKTSAQYSYDPRTRTQTRAPTDPEMLKDAISVFQEAYELYHEQDYRLKEGS
jgi:hypothetical protein